jgi:hypothetical protein
VAFADFTSTAASGQAATVAKLDGDAQRATVAQSVPLAPSVVVRDRLDNPVAGVTVTFAVTAGGGTVDGATQVTGADGAARVRSWTLGTTAGANALAATVSGLPPVAFTATGVADAPVAVAKDSGDAQSAPAGAPLSKPVVARVSDQYGNPVPGVRVTFTATAANGSPSAGTAATDTAGRARTGWTLGTSAGVDTLVASIDGAAAARFTATALPGAPSRVVVSPDSARLTWLGATVQLSATAADQYGNPVPDAAFTWTSADPDVASVSSEGFVTARANGLARVVARTSAGADTAFVRVAQQVSAVRVMPDTATIRVGSTKQFTATATDQGGATVAGQTFAWSTSDSAVARVSATGVATGAKAGTAKIRATTAGKTGEATLTVTR